MEGVIGGFYGRLGAELTIEDGYDAARGIGLCCAEWLRASGPFLITDLDADSLESTAKALEAQGAER